MSRRLFTQKEITFLQQNYESYMREMRLDELANILHRNKTTICAKARVLGLTNQQRIYLKGKK